MAKGTARTFGQDLMRGEHVLGEASQEAGADPTLPPGIGTSIFDPVLCELRKLGKTHQNILIFLKGDAKQATAALGSVQVEEDLEDADQPSAGQLFS